MVQRGFTLIEMVIVVAVVAILAALALPSYNEQMRKTRRADAKTALTTVAALQERHYMRNNRYTGNLDDLGGNADESPEGYYDVAVSVAGCPSGQPDESCFVLTATPDAAGPQADDAQCATFMLSDTGAKSSESDGGVATDCW